MDRRQVLLGGGASAVALSGFIPWAGAQNGVGVAFAPFTQGLRGSYALRGAAALAGSIPAVSGGGTPSPTPAPSPTPGHLPPVSPSPHASGQPAVKTNLYSAAPARQPAMSIVTVPRNAARREVSTFD